MRGGGLINILPVGPGSRTKTGYPEKGFGYSEWLHNAKTKFDKRMQIIKNTENSGTIKRSLNFNKSESSNSSVVSQILKNLERKFLTYNEYSALYDKYRNKTSLTKLEYDELVKIIANDFEHNWEIFVSKYHGQLLDEIITVPANMYIKFNGVSGRIDLDITTDIFLNLLNSDYTDIADSFLKKSSLFSTDIDYMTRKNKLLYNLYNVSDTFYYKHSDIKTTIYGPGEKLYNIYLSHNYTKTDNNIDERYIYYQNLPVIHGTFKIPNKDINKDINKEFADIDLDNYLLGFLIRSDKAKINKFKNVFKKFDLFPHLIDRNFTLKDLFNNFKRISDKSKTQFIYINTCRGFGRNKNITSEINTHKLMKLRRASLTGIMEEKYNKINNFERFPNTYIIKQKLHILIRKAINNTLTSEEFTLLEELSKRFPDIYITIYDSVRKNMENNPVESTISNWSKPSASETRRKLGHSSVRTTLKKRF